MELETNIIYINGTHYIKVPPAFRKILSLHPGKLKKAKALYDNYHGEKEIRIYVEE